MSPTNLKNKGNDDNKMDVEVPASNSEKKSINLIPEPKKGVPPPIKKVVTHPLVLLSAVDHSDRVFRESRNENSRVVGVLLGSLRSGILDVSNCFAVPFEEDPKDNDVWFLDHDYLELMFSMFRKVNAREKIVGWYHTGKSLCRNDIKINEVLRGYCQNAILLKVRTSACSSINLSGSSGLPVEAFYAVDEIHEDGTPTSKTFEHLSVEIDAEEAEEVGVEHLLRDIKDSSASTLIQRVLEQIESLSGLSEQFSSVAEYLSDVESGKMAVNHQILFQLQDMLNLLPELSVVGSQLLAKALNSKTNDLTTVLYVNSVARGVVALHDLINNKIVNRERERAEIEEKKNKPGTGNVPTGDNSKSKDSNTQNSSDRKEDQGCSLQ